MIRRLTISLVALALVATACTYESSGTTTTTVADPEDIPPTTGPADIVLEDQRVEGTSLTLASVTMPDDGWVVARIDQGGGPGEIIGISEILRKGVIARVPIPFFLPLTEDTIVHATIHVDLDRDGVYTYEAPDSLIDEIATFANGDAATAEALIELLPPLQPGEATLEEQRTDGTSVLAAAAVLPAPGFVALMSNVQGEPGEVLAITELLPAGTVADIEFTPNPLLRVSGLVFLAAWVDRDENGLFDPAKDDIAVRVDGSLATVSAIITVVPLEPTSITVEDQEGDGTVISILQVVLPSSGFIELLTENNGQPGTRIHLSGSQVAGTHDEISIELDEVLEGEAEDEIVLWIRMIIDFDEDGAATAEDPFGLVELGGSTAQASFTFRFDADE
ncbi:MAG: hypothetical protein V3W36_02515 [Acidimicrobiia bacterium]